MLLSTLSRANALYLNAKSKTIFSVFWFVVKSTSTFKTQNAFVEHTTVKHRKHRDFLRTSNEDNLLREGVLEISPRTYIGENLRSGLS